MFRKFLVTAAAVLLVASPSLADQKSVLPLRSGGNATAATVKPQNGSVTATGPQNRASTATHTQNAGPATVFPVGSGSHKGEIPGGIAACNTTCTTLPPLVELTVGSPQTWTNDNLCAVYPSDCTAFGSYNASWDPAFYTTTTLDVTLEYCGSVNLFQNAWLNLAIDCPCSSFSAAASFGYTCGDGRLQMTWTGLPAGNYYYPVLYDPSYDSAGTYTITVSAATPPPPPPNDDCSSVTPTVISVPGSQTFYGSTAGATSDCGLLGWQEAWEAFTINDPADVVIDYCGTSPAFNTIGIILADGCPCSSLIFASGYDFYTCGDGNGTTFYYGLPAGTYYLPIYAGAGNQHAYQVNINTIVPPPPPPNDDCSAVTPTVLNPGDSVTFYGNTAGATSDCPLFGVREAWEAITLTGSANVTIDYCGTSPAFFTVFIVLVDGCPCGSYTFAASYDFYTCGDNNASIYYCNLPAGTWYIPIYAESGSIGPYQINVTTSGGASPPPNDDCSGATNQVMPNGGGTLTYTGDNSGATADCPYLGWPGEAWESFTTNETLNITVDWCGTSPAFFTVGIVLDTSCPCSGSFIYASGYDFYTCGDGNASVYYNNLPAGTYYIPIYTDCGGSAGPYTMHVIGEVPPPPPPDDNCQDVVIHDLCGDPPVLVVSGDNTGATPDCPLLGGPGETWLAFTSYDTQDITVSYCGQSPPFQNAYIVIATGCPCDNYIFYSTFGACGDGNYYITWYGLPAGTYYYPVLKDPFYGAEGPYTITVTGTVAHECASACCPADTNCDGSVNGQDIQGFIECLQSGPPSNPCSPCVCDSNGDGSVNGQDIQGFIDALSNGGC